MWHTLPMRRKLTSSRKLTNMSWIPLILLSFFGMKGQPAAVSLNGVVTLVRDNTKTPVMHARVFIEDDCGAPRAVTGPAGNFVIHNLRPGEHWVSAYDEDGTAGGVKYIQLEDGGKFEEIDIRDMPPIQLPGATVGQKYSHQLSVNDSGTVTYQQMPGGTAVGLKFDSGLLEGTPRSGAPGPATIRVQACAKGKAPLEGLFLIPIEPAEPCPQTDRLAWCEHNPQPPETHPEHWVRFSQQTPIPPLTTPFDQWPDSTWVVQFDRLADSRGTFGHFPRNPAVPDIDAGSAPPELVNAVNGSKVPISGSILIRHGLPNCAAYQWKVVTETVDSSNVLVYLSSEVNVFCDRQTLLIVLPVHAIWATAVGSWADPTDPVWKPLGAAPAGHECNGSVPVAPNGIPRQGIKPCDDFGRTPTKYLFYPGPIAWAYNRLTQPGATQGSISLAPWAIKTKGTWDSQAYVSTRVHSVWLGLTAIYEHDRTSVDDLDSLTAAFTVDWRPGNTQFIRPLFPFWAHERFCGGPECPEDHTFGWRLPEITLRAGPEWAPHHGPNEPKQASDLNFVTAALVRLPIIISAPPGRLTRNQPQPSMISVLPAFGVEGGPRLNPLAVSGTAAPPQIRRLVTGADASLRWPYNFTHAFLGDRPITLEDSFRARRLYRDEPYVFTSGVDPLGLTYPSREILSAGWRYYNRLTLILPFSAYLQARTSLQLGALPPLFQKVGGLWTVGVTFSNPGSSEH